MRVLISGIGRSGTTMMYQQIGRMMREAFRATRYRYEPYLWDLNVPYTAQAHFSQQDLSSFGMHVHQAAPLFLTGDHPVHDEFLDAVFGHKADKPGDPAPPDSWLVKIIRGNGRLEPYLRRFPELKVILCLRNPIDTLNSSLGMFSFTGEEFHRSDTPRLLAEVGERFPHIALPQSPTPTNLATSAIWWRAFTEASLQTAADFPDRCYLFTHETFVAQPEAETSRLTDFLGFSSADTFRSNINGPAGRKTSNSYLLSADIAELSPHLAYYQDAVLRELMPLRQRNIFQAQLLRRNAERRFAVPVAGDALGRRSSLQLREMINHGGDPGLRYAEAAPDDPKRVPLQHHVRQYTESRDLKLGDYKSYAPSVAIRRAGFTFGCCITSYNSRDTIRDAIYSALDQTMPFDRIVVVDDASTDGTLSILRNLADRYSSLHIKFSGHNRGVSAARHFGMALLGTRFVTQLDGDDCFWPTKNREEAEVCFDDPHAIAFSPWLEDRGVKNTRTFHPGAYAGSPEYVRTRLLEHDYGIPRDMTLPAAAYFAAGGYDFRLSLFEDWDFKLRLARGQGSWKLSASQFGTVYNRRRTGRLGAGDLDKTRALTFVFLKALFQTPTMSEQSRIYLRALKHHPNVVRDTVAMLLRRCEEGQLKAAVLAPLISREWAAETNEGYRQNLLALATKVAPDWAVAN